MLKHEVLLNQTIFVGLGLLFRWFIIDTLIAPYYAELGPLITDDFLADHTPLYNVSLLADALKRRRASNPIFVDVFFSVQFLARHIFPPCDAIFFYSLFICFKISFRDNVMLLSRDEHYLNVLATALYGPWRGVAVCCVLSSIACLITYILVAIIQWLTRPWMAWTSWNRKKAALFQLETIQAKITLLTMALHSKKPRIRTCLSVCCSSKATSVQLETAAQERVHLRLEMTRQIRQQCEVKLQWMQMRLEELRMGDLDEERLIELYEFAQNRKPANVVLHVLFKRPVQVSSFGALTLATLQYPPGLAIPAFGLGYLPFALYCAYRSVILSTMSKEALLEDPVSNWWRFNFWIFALGMYLCHDVVTLRFLETRRMQLKVRNMELDIQIIRMALNRAIELLDEFDEYIQEE